jgi:hypothetical protein
MSNISQKTDFRHEKGTKSKYYLQKEEEKNHKPDHETCKITN